MNEYVKALVEAQNQLDCHLDEVNPMFESFRHAFVDVRYPDAPALPRFLQAVQQVIIHLAKYTEALRSLILDTAAVSALRGMPPAQRALRRIPAHKVLSFDAARLEINNSLYARRESFPVRWRQTSQLCEQVAYLGYSPAGSALVAQIDTWSYVLATMDDDHWDIFFDGLEIDKTCGTSLLLLAEYAQFVATTPEGELPISEAPWWDRQMDHLTREELGYILVNTLISMVPRPMSANLIHRLYDLSIEAEIKGTDRRRLQSLLATASTHAC